MDCGLARLGINLVKVVLTSPFVIALPYVACHLPLKFMYFDLVDLKKWDILNRVALTVLDKPFRFLSLMTIPDIYSSMVPFLCDFTMIASLELDLVLFKITFGMCIC